MKFIDNRLSYLEINFLNFDSSLGIKRCGKIFVTVWLIYRHCAIMGYSEKLSDIKTLGEMLSAFNKHASISFGILIAYT